MIKYYNTLNGLDKEFAIKNHLPIKETTIKVVGCKRFSGPLWQQQKCGDGTFGFATRFTTDPNPINERRTTICRKRKNACRLVSNADLRRLCIDPIKQRQKQKEWKKFKRNQNRNNKARRGHKTSVLNKISNHKKGS